MQSFSKNLYLPLQTNKTEAMGSSKAGAWGREFPSGCSRKGQDDRYATGPGVRPHWSRVESSEGTFFVKNGIGKLSAVIVKGFRGLPEIWGKKNGKRY